MLFEFEISWLRTFSMLRGCTRFTQGACTWHGVWSNEEKWLNFYSEVFMNTFLRNYREKRLTLYYESIMCLNKLHTTIVSILTIWHMRKRCGTGEEDDFLKPVSSQITAKYFMQLRSHKWYPFHIKGLQGAPTNQDSNAASNRFQ